MRCGACGCALPLCRRCAVAHARARTAREWFDEPVRLFFVDPIRLSLAPTNVVDGMPRGFELTVPRAFVTRNLPLVKASLAVLQTASALGRLGGLPIPDTAGSARDVLEKQFNALGALAEGTRAHLAAQSSVGPGRAERLLKGVDEQSRALAKQALVDNTLIADGASLGDELREALEGSVGELDVLLGARWQDACGLVRVRAKDGTAEWVLSKDRAAFEEGGVRLLGAHAVRNARGSRIQSGPGAPPAPLRMERGAGSSEDTSAPAQANGSRGSSAPPRRRNANEQLFPSLQRAFDLCTSRSDPTEVRRPAGLAYQTEAGSPPALGRTRGAGRGGRAPAEGTRYTYTRGEERTCKTLEKSSSLNLQWVPS